MKNHIKLTKFIFAVGALQGVIGAGAGALTATAFSTAKGQEFWITSLLIFVPVSVLWLLFCYLAYKGLTSNHIMLKCIFWFYIAFNAFIFPIGTTVAGVSVWLWRDLKNGHTIVPEK